MGNRLTTAPTTWPLTLAQAKKQCNVPHADDDDYLDSTSQATPGLIQVATQFLERRWSIALLEQTWTLTLPSWTKHRHYRSATKTYNRIAIPVVPLMSVTSVKYYDVDNAQQTLATANYDVDTTSRPGTISLAYGYVWPTIYDRPDAVEIIYKAGFSTVAAMNADMPGVTHAIRLLIAHWYRNREAVHVGTVPHRMEEALDAIAEQFNFNVGGG